MNIRKSLFAVALTALAGSALAAHADHHAGGTGQDHGQQAQARPKADTKNAAQSKTSDGKKI